MSPKPRLTSQRRGSSNPNRRTEIAMTADPGPAAGLLADGQVQVLRDALGQLWPPEEVRCFYDLLEVIDGVDRQIARPHEPIAQRRRVP